MVSVKDQAEVLIICDHFKFKYFWQLKKYLVKFRPDLLPVLSVEFVDRIKSRLFRMRVTG